MARAFEEVVVTSSVDVEIQKQFYEEPKRDSQGRAYGTGRRKVASSRVWIIPGGTGAIIIGGKTLDDYFPRKDLQIFVRRPLAVCGVSEVFDVWCTVLGGGIMGQAQAISHGVARALNDYNPPIFRPILKANGLLTRDSRMVESKKYGRHKARKQTQYSKR